MATAKTNKIDIFYDSDGTRPAINSISVSENTINSNKYLSGVRFYSLNDIFDISLSSNNIYDNTYSQNQVFIDLHQFAADNQIINNNSPGVTGPSSPPAIGDNFSYSSTFTISQSDKMASDAIVEAYGIDPIGSGPSTQSPSGNYLICTYGNKSTDLEELFLDENYRLPNSNYNSIITNLTGQWNSANLLTNGNSQVWIGKLVYPDIDYTSGYHPSQTANYSSFSGDQVYLRAFKSTTPHTNIILELDGWNVSEWPYNNIEIEIKLPTQTGWLRGDVAFNSADFTGADGDGCYVANRSSGNQFYFTFGTFSTANSGYEIVIRIKYKNNLNLKEITQIRALNW